MAANLLIKAVLAGEGVEYSVDKFVYPICFNMRHSVELRLKGLCNSFLRLAEHRGKLGVFDLKGSHDIGELWKYVKASSAQIDSRFDFFVGLLDERIEDIAEVDSTGQTFRYPDSTENVKHLVDVSLINIKNLSNRFSEIESILDYFEYFCEDIIREYSFGTYTSKLSRTQLLSIGYVLPPKSEWGSVEFKELAEELKEKYRLSNNDFSKALNKIKAHYGGAPALEPPNLFSLDINTLHAFFDAWIQLNDFDFLKSKVSEESVQLGGKGSIEDFFEDIEARAKTRVKIWSEIGGLVSVDLLADLKALYQCHNSKYSEEYIRYFNINKKTLENKCGLNEDSLEESFFDFLWKPRAVVYILKGLFLVGHSKLANEFISNYKLAEHFDWLEDARSRKLFLEPCRVTLISFIEVLRGFYIRD